MPAEIAKQRAPDNAPTTLRPAHRAHRPPDPTDHRCGKWYSTFAATPPLPRTPHTERSPHQTTAETFLRQRLPVNIEIECQHGPQVHDKMDYLIGIGYARASGREQRCGPTEIEYGRHNKQRKEIFLQPNNQIHCSRINDSDTKVSFFILIKIVEKINNK